MTNGEVSFTVKEMFQEVDKKLEYIIGQLTSKADKTDLEGLTGRLDLLEGEVKSFKLAAKLVGGALTLAVTVGLAVLQARGGV